MMQNFSSAAELARTVNAYLDDLVGRPPKSAEEARERLRTLLFFRDEMVAFHFPNPRFAVMDLMRILHDALRRMDKDDRSEVLPELRAIRYTYELRKMTYDRARAAYVANRAALWVFENGLFEEYLEFLPYGGEYLAALEEYGGTVLAVYRRILELLGVREERIELDEQGNLVEKRAERGVFGDRVSTEVLISTILRKALSREWGGILEEERRSIENYERVSEYESIVRRYSLDTLRENPDKLWELLQTLEERGFLKDGDIDPSIIEGLRKKRQIRFDSALTAGLSELKEFLFKYYLLTPERIRRNKPVFLGLPATPEPVLDFLGSDGELLQEKAYLESVLRIPSAHLGLALLHIRRGVGLKELSREYGVSMEDLSTAVDTVRAVLSGNERVRRFMRFLRGEE